MRKSLTAIGVATAALAISGGIATQAMAHAMLVSTTPAKGSTVTALPPFVKIRFDEALASVSSVQLKDAKGVDHVVTAGLDPKNAAVIVAKTTKSAAGRYNATYKVTCDDGHRMTGTFTFRVK